MPKKKGSNKRAGKVVRDIQKAVIGLHSATEEYLHAALELARLQGKSTYKKVRPHVLALAKNVDKLHSKVVGR